MKRSTVRRLERLEKRPAKDPTDRYDELVQRCNDAFDRCVAEQGFEQAAALIKSVFTPEQIAEMSDIRAMRAVHGDCAARPT